MVFIIILFTLFLLNNCIFKKGKNSKLEVNCKNKEKLDSNSVLDTQFQNEIIKWRRLAGELSCKISNGVGPTGGWCLHPSNEIWGELGRSAEHHVVADSGIGKALIKYLKNDERPVSLIDVGTGVGQYGYWLKVNNANIQWSGYDGAENVEEFTNGFVKWIDVTNPLFDSINFVADWIMSLECGEHIPPENTNNLISLLDKHNKQGIILSWAVPGQGGYSHINERQNNEIIQLLSQKGYTQDAWCLEFQEYARKEAIYFWFQGTFMVFKRI